MGGLESVLAAGVVAGFPVLGIKATLVDGAYHDVDSSVLAFEIAGRAACREGLRKCKSRLKEPVMKVDVQVPEEFMGEVIGDFMPVEGRSLSSVSAATSAPFVPWYPWPTCSTMSLLYAL